MSIPAWASQRGKRMYGGSLEDTSFALLFLKRATRRVAGVATVGGDIDIAISQDLADGAFKDLFEAVLDRYAKGEATQRFERARDFVRLGTRSIPLLILRLEDENDGNRAVAIEVLKQCTGFTAGFDPEAPNEGRAAAVRAWEAWWLSHRDRVVADVDAGKFLEK